jgi:hypothetical protein
MELKIGKILKVLQNRIDSLEIPKTNLKVSGFSLDPYLPNFIALDEKNQKNPEVLKMFMSNSDFCEKILEKRAKKETELSKRTGDFPFRLKEKFATLQKKIEKLLDHV